jgi:hypothetical protein
LPRRQRFRGPFGRKLFHLVRCVSSADSCPAARPTSWRASSRNGCPFGKLIADETEKWGKVVKFAAMKPE